jgi:nucleoside-diphosphate-sugar epimerase
VAARLADRPVSVLARPTSSIAVLPSGLDIRYGTLEDPHLPLQDVASVVYCASMGFGHVPRLIDQLASASVERAVFVSTTAIFTSLPAASRAPRLDAEASVTRSTLDWTIVRPTMIYGTARDRNISRLLRFLDRWPFFPVCGNALWQPIHVDDLAEAIVTALDNSITSRRTYNLAGAYPLRFEDLVRTAARAVHRRVILLRVPVASAVLAARLTHVVSVEQVRRLAEDKAFDYGAATRDIGFRPRTFAEGVALEARALGF